MDLCVQVLLLYLPEPHNAKADEAHDASVRRHGLLVVGGCCGRRGERASSSLLVCCCGLWVLLAVNVLASRWWIPIRSSRVIIEFRPGRAFFVVVSCCCCCCCCCCCFGVSVRSHRRRLLPGWFHQQQQRLPSFQKSFRKTDARARLRRGRATALTSRVKGPASCGSGRTAEPAGAPVWRRRRGRGTTSVTVDFADRISRSMHEMGQEGGRRPLRSIDPSQALNQTGH
jgi:hypothetical protein